MCQRIFLEMHLARVAARANPFQISGLAKNSKSEKAHL
jgi:hypothetical protein